jgi:hypothetical protein
MEVAMAETDREEERAAVEEDRRTLRRAKRKARRHKHEDAGARQISERLDAMTGAADLDNPQRYHGS